jgi:hypothetical protein
MDVNAADLGYQSHNPEENENEANHPDHRSSPKRDNEIANKLLGFRSVMGCCLEPRGEHCVLEALEPPQLWIQPHKETRTSTIAPLAIFSVSGLI